MNAFAPRELQNLRNFPLRPDCPLMKDDQGVIRSDFIDEVGGPEDRQLA